MGLFDDAGRKRIADAIAKVEQQSASELVVVAAPSAEDYRDLRAIGAAFTALAAAAGVHAFVPELSATWLLWLQAGVFALAWFALQVPVLLRAALPSARAQRSVEERAERELLEQGVLETVGRTGVLILLCELEHRVVIIGDKGIHARVQIEGWKHHVDSIVKAIASGRAADGVCQVIEELGVVLAREVPRQANDTNELSDSVREPER